MHKQLFLESFYGGEEVVAKKVRTYTNGFYSKSNLKQGATISKTPTRNPKRSNFKIQNKVLFRTNSLGNSPISRKMAETSQTKKPKNHKKMEIHKSIKKIP
jgi:hypothetical protein